MYLSAAVYLEEALCEHASWGGVGSELPVSCQHMLVTAITLECSLGSWKDWIFLQTKGPTL